MKSFRLFDFKAYDGEDINESSEEFVYPTEKKFYIEMIGINELGQSCSIIVTDYKPFFYVEVTDDWEEGNARSLQTYLNGKISKRKEDSVRMMVCEAELVEYNKLYGFTGGKKSKFVKLTFENNYIMNKVKNMWYSYSEEINEETGEQLRDKVQTSFIYQGCNMKIYEGNIPPLLRYLHINKVSPSGWVSIPIKEVIVQKIDRRTSCDYEYICKVKQVIPMPEKETIVPFKIMSYDIEAGSSHGDFPVPVKTYKKLSTNIVDIFIKKRTNIKKTAANTLFKKIIIKAFYEEEKILSLKQETIDKVYPKEKPSKEELEKYIERMIKEKVESIVSKESRNDILRISDAFEKSEDSEDDEERGSKKEKIDKKMTIIELLCNTEKKRDSLINELNEILTSTLPDLEGDPVTFIGSTFMKYGEETPYYNHCIVLNGCEKVENVEIECYETEKEVLLAWKRLIDRENPDIIIGYNIFGFDYEFMFQRAKENRCVEEFLKLSRNKEEVCGKMKNYKVESIENTKIVIASGEYDLKYVNMFGRLQIDMYAYFRRDFNLSSYKLDDVAGQYISDDIKKIKYEGNETHLYTKNIIGLNVGDYIHIELVSFTTDHYDNGRKIKVKEILYDVCEGDKTYNVLVVEGLEEIETNKKLKWGMAKDDVTPQDIFRLTKGDDKDRAIVAKYCIQDCNLVHYLMNKIDVITGYVEMASICSVPISYLVFRGQGIKLTSYVAKKCREKETLMPDLQKPKNASGYEGAIVLPPKCDMYMDNPVACVDYSSLYPSSMISQNYSHDSKVWTKTYDNNNKLVKTTGERNKKGEFIYDNLEEYEYIDIEYDIFEYRRPANNPKGKAEKTKVGRKICRWAQLPKNQKSIMPSILEELLKARKDTRKKIKTENDPFMKNILDKRQLGYKVTANSLYGQCGARTSTFYEVDVAASTTATGRMMIIYGKRMIEELYGDSEYTAKDGRKLKTNAEYIYGDTDSVFFTFNLKEPETNEKVVGYDALKYTIELAQEAAEVCSMFLKPPMFLEYEKTLMPFILLSKKRYVGMLYEDDPDNGHLKYMGLSIKRRDSCDYLKDTYGEIINILMNESNINSAINYLNESLNRLADGSVNTDKLLITKALRGYYKNPDQIAHQVLADRIGKRDPGNKPKPGDRMRYLFYVNANKKALNGEKIETPEFIKEKKLKIDYSYYVTNQLMKPLQQLFGLALEKIYDSQDKKNAIKKYNEELKILEKDCGQDFELFMKKKEKISSSRIKNILFDNILRKINNERNNIRSITSYFNN